MVRVLYLRPSGHVGDSFHYIYLHVRRAVRVHLT